MEQQPQGFQSTHGVGVGASKEDMVQKRVILDVPASGESVTKWMDNFFMNHAYGALSLNILSDIFVRTLFFICSYLALLRCWRAKERETRLTNLQIQQSLDSHLKRQSQFCDTYFRSDSFIRRVSRATISDSQSSSTPTVLLADSQVQANSPDEHLSSVPIIQDSTAGISPTCLPVAIISTECTSVVTGVDKMKGPSDCAQLPKRRNGYVYDCHILDGSPSFQHLHLSLSESSTSESGTSISTQACDEVVIDIPAICVFPSSTSIEIGNKFKKIMMVKMDVSFDHDISSSRILQARVRASHENLTALRDIAVEGMKLDEGFTLQVGGSFLYCCNGNPEEPVLLSLRDVQVPTILQADYSAGAMTIRGIYLEGAEIRAATFDGYMILNCIQQDQSINDIPLLERRLEVWKCVDLLPPVSLDRIQICASKTVQIEGQDVTVRSEVLSIQNNSLRTLIRNWVPIALLIGFLVIQAWILLDSLLKLTMDPLYRPWLSYPILAFAIYIIQLLPPSLEDNIKSFLERLQLAISSFHAFPDLFNSPAFIMRNGSSFQWGAQHLVESKLSAGGPMSMSSKFFAGSPSMFPSKLSAEGTSKLSARGPSKLSARGSRHRQAQRCDPVSPHSPKIHEIPPTSREWNWPCFKEVVDVKTNKLAIERLELTDSSPVLDDVSYPFTVTYRESIKQSTDDGTPTRFVPKIIVVKLYSKHLQVITSNLLSTSLKHFQNYVEIEAKDLFVLYITKAFEKNVNLETESNDPLASSGESHGECLDMFHLIRFLKKEYADTIIQYERMMEAGVISWDMLWTVIVPQADVIYYCNISKERLCGKVISTDRKMERPYRDKPGGASSGPGFWIKLEVSDYNCINFTEMKTDRVISPFKGEVKISDLDVYPLERAANPCKEEEFFLMRGRRYYDLVLKHEHRFMQYHGQLFTSRKRNMIPSGSSFRHKENAHGRVMIDQRGFARMQPDHVDMNTAESSKEWLQGMELKRKTAPVDENNPLLKYSPAITYGYSFASRKWGCFMIEGISEIQFISTAFDTLVMNEDIKNTLLTLTRHHVKHQQGTKDASLINVDPLPHKGKGCIILLHGPPGTGKTLTVESLAEKLECPLWQLGVGYKNSISTEQLETELLKTFEVAASWGAILVLDEADVYLSTRKYSPMSSNVTQTNAITGAFLRILEYYTGILFLTTNVIDSIESAIYSRMSLFVKYEEFSIEERKQLWTNFLNRIGFQHPSQEFWDKVLPQRFNGRVIRNIVQNAQILAQDSGRSLSEEHLLKAFQVMAAPSTSRLIESEDRSEPGPKESAFPTNRAHGPGSVVTDSTISQLRSEEYRSDLSGH